MTDMHDVELPKPTFIGVGVMKCATTWIAECLRQHPEAFLSSPKEIHYFGGDNYERGPDWYLEHFRGGADSRVRGEYTVDYFSRDFAARRILEDLGRVKIIISLRDPRTRFYSAYKHYVRQGRLDAPCYRTCTADTIDRLLVDLPVVLTDGLYAEHIARFFELFGRENVLIVFKEHIDARPEAELRRIYRFLDIREDFDCSLANRTVSRGIIPRFPILETIRIRTYRLVNRVHPELIPRIRRSGVMEIYRKLNARGTRDTFADTGPLEARLCDYYSADDLALRKLLETDVPYDLTAAGGGQR